MTLHEQCSTASWWTQAERGDWNQAWTWPRKNGRAFTSQVASKASKVSPSGWSEL
jgi:hypothetical protein